MAAGCKDTKEAIRTTRAVTSREHFIGISSLPDQWFAARSHYQVLIKSSFITNVTRTGKRPARPRRPSAACFILSKPGRAVATGTLFPRSSRARCLSRLSHPFRKISKRKSDRIGRWPHMARRPAAKRGLLSRRRSTWPACPDTGLRKASSVRRDRTSLVAWCLWMRLPPQRVERVSFLRTRSLQGLSLQARPSQ